MGKIIFFLILLFAIPCYGLDLARLSVGIMGGGGATGQANCSTSEIVPTADTLTATWSKSGGATYYSNVDELLAGRNDSDAVYAQDYGSGPITLRFTLPSSCTVNTIRTEERAARTGAGVTGTVDISNDNSNWVGAQTTAYTTTTPTEIPKTFSSLNWTSSTYCYVKVTLTSSTYNSLNMFSLSITVNP
jgi:hypothetical protein